ncbi:hypothetical protein VTK26DRAFT_2612 [Humicola hyalothermophila]
MPTSKPPDPKAQPANGEQACLKRVVRRRGRDGTILRTNRARRAGRWCDSSGKHQIPTQLSRMPLSWLLWMLRARCSSGGFSSPCGACGAWGAIGRRGHSKGVDAAAPRGMGPSDRGSDEPPRMFLQTTPLDARGRTGPFRSGRTQPSGMEMTPLIQDPGRTRTRLLSARA